MCFFMLLGDPSERAVQPPKEVMAHRLRNAELEGWRDREGGRKGGRRREGEKLYVSVCDMVDNICKIL